METWQATPLVGVNGVTFGMPREKVRRLWGPRFSKFKKNEFSRNSSDDFGIAHVYYDESGLCEAVEIFADVTVNIGKQTVFPTSVAEAQKVFPDLIEDDGTLISAEKSIGISMLENEMECILFGKEGYYE